MEGATAQRVIARPRDRGKAVGVAGVVAAVALVTWPVASIAPGVGADWSWVAGLAYAAEHGMRFGDQIVWSYGPLGFLDTWYGPSLYYGDVLALSWLYVALLHVLLALALLTALRRALPLAAAALVTAVVVTLVRDLAPALGLTWCALALTRPDDAPIRAFPLALGALTGVALLGKLNVGIELLAVALVTSAARPRWRDAFAFAGALAAAAAAGWLATGQTLADVVPYVRNGMQIVAGYAAAMGTADAAHAWALAAALALAGLALALGWLVTQGLARRVRCGLLALALVYAAFSFKEGFVRQDGGHLEVFFGDLLVLFAVLPLQRRPHLLAPALAALVAGVVAIGGVLGAHHVVRRLNPVANVAAVADQARTLVSPGRQDALTADLRGRLQALYRITPRIRAAVGGRPVMFWPFLFAEAAYAYGLDLRPLSSFEPYGAYTPALDRLGARMLASARAPARIVRADVAAIDGRDATFEAPLATLQIFCRYRQLLTEDVWQVLARASDRCATPRPLATRVVRWGQPVPVPAPRSRDALVLVRVEGAGPQGLERLRTLVLRPERRWIALGARRYRLVAATAADGLLLSAPPRLDYPGAFALAARPARIAVGRDGGEPGGTLTYRFEEVPLRPIPAVARAP
ncbi:MAG: hypothetical protein JSS99_02325 [Actinobacteria bacterium]|nr:hypothetical protein [Actinomycetota bacterium]